MNDNDATSAGGHAASASRAGEAAAGVDALHVDVEAVVGQRLSRYRHLIPKVAVNWLKRTICQDELNGLLDRTRGTTGAQFCAAVLRDLNVRYRAEGVLPDPAKPRVIIVCNHPLGALDGIIMIHWAAATYGPRVHFIVNDILTAVKPLRGVFLPVNLYGRQSRHSTVDIEEVFRGQDPIIMFPAGLVSRKRSNGVIRDLKWHKMFVNKAIEHHRDVIPVYFDARNSPFFYNFAKMRRKIGLRFNFEMVYLPREIFRSRDATFRFIVGEALPWHTLQGGRRASRQAQQVKRTVYGLNNQPYQPDDDDDDDDNQAESD